MFKPVPFSSIGMSEARAYDGFSDFSQTPNTQLNFLSIYLDYFSRKFLFCFLCASARYIMNLKYIGAQQQSLLCLRAYSHQWMALMFTIHEFCEMKKNNNNEQRKKHTSHKNHRKYGQRREIAFVSEEKIIRSKNITSEFMKLESVI